MLVRWNLKGSYVMRSGLWAVLLVLAGVAGIASANPGDERILTARDAASKGDVARLATLAATPSAHVLEPYVQYWLLSARIARLTDPVDQQAINSFLTANTGSYLAERLRGEWVRRLGFEKRWPDFNANYGLLQQADQAAQCYAIQSGGLGSEAARGALVEQWLTLLDVPASCEAPMQGLVLDGKVSAEDVWQRFRRLVENKRFGAARNALSWQGAGPAPAALGTALENPARFLASARATSSRTDRELILAAITRLARSDVRSAAERWRSIESNAFRAEEKAYAWGQLGWMGGLAQIPEAAAWFKRAQGTNMSADQRAWSVRSNLRNEDWAGVRQTIEALPSEQRDSPEWSYWLGRALQNQGKTEAAQQQFLHYADMPNFYGILSAEALGNTYGWPKAASPATNEELARARRSADFQRAEALYRLELRTEGLREWNWGLRSADDRYLLAAAEHARQLGLYDRAISTAERTRNEHDFALRYLAPYYDAFSRNAEAQQLDLAWVYGLVRQESRFQSVARSGVGAQGLMQVMPATGQWLAKKQGWSDYHPGWLTGIDTNIQLGSAYLRYVLDTLSNHRVLASAAYNAGPARARRWRSTRPLEGAIYIETIPFAETRDYVKKVMANAELYSPLFDKRPISLGKRLGTIPASGAELSRAPEAP